MVWLCMAVVLAKLGRHVLIFFSIECCILSKKSIVFMQSYFYFLLFQWFMIFYLPGINAYCLVDIVNVFALDSKVDLPRNLSYKCNYTYLS